ncbi:MAG: small ribosomal subunit Rsm22 family protein [Desulfovibrionaceae bacterium]|nr:small ribosomal subunit Rsm22 family protein [Desulfovibrionaceae bacterium]
MKTVIREFFPQLSADARRALEQLPAALDAVLPLKAAHRRDLPAAVRELSARLTCERGGNELPYWSSPRLASAYLRYFLPWNLMRLTRLTAALELPCPSAGAAERALLLDIGSGPLTLPLAVWLAKPQWRELPLDVACLDSSPRALELGRELFSRVAGESAMWRIIPVRGGVNALAREAHGRPWLISAANVLNELKTERAEPSARLAAFTEQAAKLLHPRGAILCVEPGTRLGGKIVQSLREEALALGLAPVQPCPHAQSCPLEGMRTWCHFSLGVQGMPDWLAQLAREARLPKKDLHLSFALLQRQSVQRRDAAGEGGTGQLAARVISAPFKLPGTQGLARYACSARGLLLLTRASDMSSGALVEVQWPARPRRDDRSGAWIV